MTTMLEKCKALAKKTHQSSSVANQALKDKCKSMGVKFAKLQNPNQTRWNSQLTNMESVLRLKAPLQELFEEDETGAWYDVSLTAADWKLMQGAVTLLKPFLFATKAWEAECTPTINLVIERLYTIHASLNDFSVRTNCRHALSFARALQQMLEQRFPNQGMDVEERAMANYLDPRFKGIHLALAARKAATKELIKERFGEEEQDIFDNDPEIDVAPLSPTSKLLHQNQVVAGHQGDSKMDKEMNTFEQMPNQDRNTNPLDFYRINEGSLPLLAKAARTIFAIPASSSKSERAFSKGTRTVSKARTSLAPEKAEDLVVINENEDKINEFKKTRKIDLTEVKRGAFKKVVVEVVDLEEEDEEDNDEEELLAYLEDLEEREEDVEEVTLNELV